jgi:protein tyrosine phosphatase
MMADRILDDFSRVILKQRDTSGEGDDYINANFVNVRLVQESASNVS